MPTKWDVERAVMRDTRGKADRAWILEIPALPAPARLIMLTLLSRADADTAIVPEGFTPSLTELAALTGLDRSTVRRQLNRIEEDGWAVRNRPDVADARTNGAKTQYELCIPGRGVGAESPYLGADSPHVGAESARGRGTAPLIPSSNQSDLDQSSGDDRKRGEEQQEQSKEQKILAVVVEEVRARTGTTIPASWAPRVRACILENSDGTERDVADEIAYLRAAIRAEPDPRGRFLPSLYVTPAAPQRPDWCGGSATSRPGSPRTTRGVRNAAAATRSTANP